MSTGKSGPWRSIHAVLVPLTVLAVFIGCEKSEGPERPELFGYQDTTPMEVTGFTPTEGLAGDVVRITGSNFEPGVSGNRVFIGGATVSVIAATDSTLDVVVPVYAAGGVIRVESVNGFREGQSEGSFVIRTPNLASGYTGGGGEPVITSDLPASSSTTSTAIVIGGDVSGTTENGYWALTDNTGLVRSQGILPVSGGRYDGTLPLFCGAQWLVVYFDNGTGRGFHRVDVTRTTCTEPGMRVKLSWDTDDTDVDTHLIMPGSQYQDSVGDCYFANSNPDWGVPGDPSDDPELDVDDTTGFGPENIYVDPSDAGAYQVTIHYWSDHGNGVSNPWVELFIDGVRTQAFGPKEMSSGQVWNVCTIDWPSGVVTGL